MKVVFLDTVHSILKERLRDGGFNCLDATHEDKLSCITLLKDANGIVIRSKYEMDENFLKHAPRLKFIARSGAGLENIDMSYCKQKGIEVFNSPEGNRNAVGEHALGMLLALFNNLPRADREVRAGKWNREKNRGTELKGKTVAIIGYGNNGAAFANKLKGMDVSVIAYDKYKTGFGDAFVTETDLDIIHSNADVVSLHIPENEETRYFVDGIFLSAFKKPIYLINLSRGKIVNTSALIKAIESKKVTGACLDVLEYEKTNFESIIEKDLDSDFSNLLNSDKVILSPHIGGWTAESYFKLSNVLADKILDRFAAITH